MTDCTQYDMLKDLLAHPQTDPEIKADSLLRLMEGGDMPHIGRAMLAGREILHRGDVLKSLVFTDRSDAYWIQGPRTKYKIEYTDTTRLYKNVLARSEVEARRILDKQTPHDYRVVSIDYLEE